MGGLFDTISNIVVPFVGSDLVGAFTPPQAPTLQPPNAKSNTPTLAETNTTALQAQLNKEHNERAISVMTTGQGGLLDEPTTMSTVLLGN